MNPLSHKECPVCGCDSFQQLKIESGHLFVEDKLFHITGYPGLVCKDCKEIYIERSLHELFQTCLKEGHYEPVQTTYIPSYRLDATPGNLTKKVLRLTSSNDCFVITDVPYTKKNGYEEIEYPVLKAIRVLHSQVEKEEVSTKDSIEVIMVKFA